MIVAASNKCACISDDSIAIASMLFSLHAWLSFTLAKHAKVCGAVNRQKTETEQEMDPKKLEWILNRH